MDTHDITHQIIGCAYDVFNSMGFGFLESVYENCMVIELRRPGHEVANQHAIQVRYKGQVVGNFEADLFVDGQVIVELKSVRALAVVHEVQLVNYLKATGIDTGLLINFGERQVEVRRKYRTRPDAADEHSDS